MSTRIVRSFLLVSIPLLTLAGGCNKDSGSDPASKEKPAPADKSAKGHDDEGHAPGGVKPGSHEDWCGEHAVPESQCTRCNPELIPAFKATNDWCEEHQLPHSQDTVHHPEIVITRPPKGS